jgi:hypothetical protein
MPNRGDQIHRNNKNIFLHLEARLIIRRKNLASLLVAEPPIRKEAKDVHYRRTSSSVEEVEQLDIMASAM